MSRSRLAVFLLAGLVPASAVGAQTPSGPRFVVAGDRTPQLFDDVFRVDPDGRTTNLTHSLDSERRPWPSPDGRWTAFEVSWWGEGAGRVSVVPTAGGARRPLSEIGPHVDVLGWSSDSRHLLAEHRGYPYELLLLEPGHRQRVLYRGKRGLGTVRWSHDGTQVAAAVDHDRSDAPRVLVFDIRSGRRTTLVGTHPLAWSRDGRLAVADAGRRIHVYERGRLRASFPGDAFGWSPDGSQLAVHDRNRLTVRAHAGAGPVIARVTAARCAHELVWRDATHVALGASYSGCPPIELDVPDNLAYDLTKDEWRNVTCHCHASDGRKLETVRHGAGFAIRVSVGGRSRILAPVPTCRGNEALLGHPTAAVDGLRFAGAAVVYTSACRELPSHIYVGDGAGSLRRVTSASTDAFNPIASPDGLHVAYFEHRSPASGPPCIRCDSPIRVMDADGSHQHPITRISLGPDGEVGPWSPDGTQILFKDGEEVGGAYDRWSAASIDGSPPRALPFLKWTPVWIPGGFAYSYTEGIWTVRRDGSGAHLAVPLDATVMDLAPAPDGRLAWTDADDGLRGSLHVAAPDGSDVRDLAPRATRDLYLLGWSRDGRLAWTDGTSLWILTGGTVKRIRPPFASGTWGAGWARAGELLVAGERYAGAPFDLYALSADGTGLRRLTVGLGVNGAGWLR